MGADEFAYRATSADGLVVGVREIKHDHKGGLAFWVRAIENEIRAERGYALLETRDVKTKRGLVGRQLRFGHDEKAGAHLYSVSVFITPGSVISNGYIYIVETGGRRALAESNEAALQTAMESLNAD